MLKVTDFKLNNDNKTVLKISNETEIMTDYIIMSTSTVIDLEGESKNKTLKIINEIYAEHNKLVLLGLGYPIYRIQYLFSKATSMERLCCSLEGVNTQYGKLESYKVKRIVDYIWFDNNIGPDIGVKELVITHPVTIYSLGKHTKIKITGIEYITNIMDTTIDVINNNIKLRDDKTLTLKCLDSIILMNAQVEGIERIILEDTCKIKDIPYDIFIRIESLKEIQLSKSVKQIQGVDIKNCLRKDKEGYFIDVNEPNINREVSEYADIVRIKFNG